MEPKLGAAQRILFFMTIDAVPVSPVIEIEYILQYTLQAYLKRFLW
ncbi:hypothetical protein [Salicibibacter cibarius]